MNTKTILNTLMVLPMAVLLGILVASCSSSDDNISGEQQPQQTTTYKIPVTVGATRNGDEAITRATYDSGERKLNFESGAQLFVSVTISLGTGLQTINTVLDNTPESPSTFTGEIALTDEQLTELDKMGIRYDTADHFFTDVASKGGFVTATLLPKDYATKGNDFLSISDGSLNVNLNKPYAAPAADQDGDSDIDAADAKKLAIEQLSYERATAYVDGTFDLAPQTAIISYSISGLGKNKNYTFAVSDYYNEISGSFTSDNSGNAYLAVAFQPQTDQTYRLKITGYIGIDAADKTLTAGKVYNKTAVAVIEGCLTGQFQVDGSGTNVLFSKGNLRATRTSSSWSWSFAENQWDYVGNAAGNTTVTSSSPFTSSAAGVVVDLFGWVGASSSWTSVNRFGVTSSTTLNNVNGYGNVTGESLKQDWGTLAITNGGQELESSWRTLSSAEWNYILNTRTGATVNSTANARYTLATINTNGTSCNGMILFPDGVVLAAGEATTWGTINAKSDWTTKCTIAQWTALEEKGCVFLPAAGRRTNGTTVTKVNEFGHYWTSTGGLDGSNSYSLHFQPGNLLYNSHNNRNYGMSVRLVRNVN